MAALYNDALASALSHIYISQCVSNVYIDKLSQLIKYQFALCTLRGHLCLLRPIHSLTYSLIHTHTLDLHSVLIGQVIFDWTICLNGVNLDLHYRSEHLMSQTLAATATSTDRPQTNQNVLSLSHSKNLSLSLGHFAYHQTSILLAVVAVLCYIQTNIFLFQFFRLRCCFIEICF